MFDLSHRIDQEVLDLWGENFESLPQAVAWIRRELVSNAYHLFLDPISLLDLLVLPICRTMTLSISGIEQRGQSLSMIGLLVFRHLLEGNYQLFLIE